MRLAIPVAFLMMALLASCQRAVDQFADAEKVAQSDTVLYDFGVLQRDGVHRGAVSFTNESAAPLTFAGGRTSCSCLSVGAIPSRIEPSEAGVFEIGLDTRALRGVQNGQVLFWATEPSKRIILVKTTAIVRACWADPEQITFGDSTIANRARRKLNIVAAGCPDANILSATAEAEWITLRHAPGSATELAKGVKLIGQYEVGFNEEAGAFGDLSAAITVAIKAGEPSVISIPVTARHPGPVLANPSQIVFGSIGSQAVTRNCTIKFNRGMEMEELSVTTDHPEIDVIVARTKDDIGELVLTLTARHSETLNTGAIRGNVTGSDINGEKVFSIPYVGINVD